MTLGRPYLLHGDRLHPVRLWLARRHDVTVNESAHRPVARRPVGELIDNVPATQLAFEQDGLTSETLRHESLRGRDGAPLPLRPGAIPPLSSRARPAHDPAGS